MGDESLHSGKVGVVAEELSAAVDDRVDRAYRAGGVAYAVEVGNDVFFIGNGDVYALEIAAEHKACELLIGDLAKTVVVIADEPMYFRGKAMPQLAGDTAVVHNSASDCYFESPGIR